MSRPGHEPDCAGGLCCEALCGRGLDPAIYGDRATVAEYALAAMTKERDAAKAEIARLTGLRDAAGGFARTAVAPLLARADAFLLERDAAVQRAAEIEQATVVAICRWLNHVGQDWHASMIEDGVWRSKEIK